MKKMKDWNVIMITLDGLRVDQLIRCPYLFSLFKENVGFSNMITASPYTFTSMHAIFSGIYPSKNGVNSYYNMFRFKKEKCKTLTQYFKENNYHTVANVLSDSVIPVQGFDRIEIHKLDDPQLPLHKRMISESMEKGKFFMYLQYTNIHDLTVKNSKKYGENDENYFGNEAKKRNSKIFGALAEETDGYVKEIMGYLEKLKILKNTMVIFHADHGTSLGEKPGEKLYGSFVYDYTIKTFCIMIMPDHKKGNTDSQCIALDIMPTILDIFEWESDTNFNRLQGKTLFPLLRGEEKKERIAFTETGGLFGPWPSRREHNVFGVRSQNKKIIYNKTPNTWEFYDLEKDPTEKNNLIGTNNPEISEYKKILLSKMKENGIKIKK